jgi:hypothetical protein
MWAIQNWPWHVSADQTSVFLGEIHAFAGVGVATMLAKPTRCMFCISCTAVCFDQLAGEVYSCCLQFGGCFRWAVVGFLAPSGTPVLQRTRHGISTFSQQY